MSKFSFQELSGDALEDWDDFVDRSPEGTVFHTRTFLEPFPQRHRFFAVMKGDDRKAGFVASSRPDAPRSMTPVWGAIHNGLLFAPELDADASRARNHSTRFALTEFVVEQLPALFDHAWLSLSPGVVDIRPFLWFHHDSSDADDKYRVDVRYTSLLDLRGINAAEGAEDTTTFRELGYSRRQEIRYALRAGVRVERRDAGDARDAIGEFFANYVAWTAAHDPSIEEHAPALLEACERLAAQGRFRVYLARTPDGAVAAQAAFALDSKRAYYLYGMTDSSSRESYCGSYVLWEAFRDLERASIAEVDLEGVNSPQRGWFKLSFGGRLVPYYRLVWPGGAGATT